MRLIDADWVLAALGVFNDRKHGDAHFFNGIASAEEIVEHAPTIATRDWTPCAEGLPNDSNPYLVTIRPSNFRDYCDMCRHYNGEWHRADGHVYKKGVLAWQPLPDPYNPDHIRDAEERQ